MMAFAKRNILLYFRDKTAIFFSLLAVLILIALYVLFLRDLIADGLPEFPSKDGLLISWFIAGVLAIASLTTTLGAFGIFVDDKENQTIMDFYASPISRNKLVSGYILSGLFVGVVMSVITFFTANVFLLLSGENMLPFSKMVMVGGVITLSVLASCSMVLFLVSFLHTSNAFASASMVIGTLLGFLAGIYIPIGALPDYLQTVVKLFPVSHSAALFRDILMETNLMESFANTPAGTMKAFELDMGVFYEINGMKTSNLFSIFYLCMITIVFFILSLLIMRRKKK